MLREQSAGIVQAGPARLNSWNGRSLARQGHRISAPDRTAAKVIVVPPVNAGLELVRLT